MLPSQVVNIWIKYSKLTFPFPECEQFTKVSEIYAFFSKNLFEEIWTLLMQDQIIYTYMRIKCILICMIKLKLHGIIQHSYVHFPCSYNTYIQAWTLASIFTQNRRPRSCHLGCVGGWRDNTAQNAPQCTKGIANPCIVKKRANITEPAFYYIPWSKAGLLSTM